MSPKLISVQRSLYIARKKYACTHMLSSACAHWAHRSDRLHSHVRMYQRQLAFFRKHQEVTLGMRKHSCIHAGALCILYEGSTHTMEARMPPRMLEHACTPNRHACTLTSVCLPIGLTFYPSMVSCIVAKMHK